MRDRLSKRGRVYHRLVSADLCLGSLAQKMWIGGGQTRCGEGDSSLSMCRGRGDFDGCVRGRGAGRKGKKRERGNAVVQIMGGNDRGIMRPATDWHSGLGMISEWTYISHTFMIKYRGTCAATGEGGSSQEAFCTVPQRRNVHVPFAPDGPDPFPTQ